jgi:hypothetical protein
MYGSTIRNGLLVPTGYGIIDSIQTWCYDFNGNGIGYGFTMTRDTTQNLHNKLIARRSHGPLEAISQQAKGFRAELPPGTVYDSISPKLQAKPSSQGIVSMHEWVLNDPRIPVHQAFEVHMQANSSRISPHLRPKVLLRTRGLSGQVAHLLGQWDGDWFKSYSRMFGRMDLVIDTVAPFIKTMLKPKSRVLHRGQALYFRISDAMSGIADYRLCAGDEWILGSYDAKNHLLEIRLDECMPLGKQSMELRVTDKVGNSRLHPISLQIEDPPQPNPNSLDKQL